MFSYEELESKIIQSGICTVCGACISACPLYYIKLMDGTPGRPKKKAACKNCGTCFNSCYRIPGENGGKGIGDHLYIVSAKWNSGLSCQDGGIVTSVLRCALEIGLIDGAVLTNGDGLRPVPYIARTADDFDNSAGTRFGVSPVLMKLREAIVEHGLNRLCVVGTPCHIQAVRHLQRMDQELSSAVVLTIGLFCSENIEYRYIEEEIKRNMLRDIDKVTVSNGEFRILTKEKTATIPVYELKSWIPGHCYFCGDYTGELADISIGSEGSHEGWSTVVIRSEAGEEIFSELKKKDGVSISGGFPDIELRRLIEKSDKKRIRVKKSSDH